MIDGAAGSVAAPVVTGRSTGGAGISGAGPQSGGFTRMPWPGATGPRRGRARARAGRLRRNRPHTRSGRATGVRGFGLLPRALWLRSKSRDANRCRRPRSGPGTAGRRGTGYLRIVTGFRGVPRLLFRAFPGHAAGGAFRAGWFWRVGKGFEGQRRHSGAPRASPESRAADRARSGTDGGSGFRVPLHGPGMTGRVSFRCVVDRAGASRDGTEG